MEERKNPSKRYSRKIKDDLFLLKNEKDLKIHEAMAYYLSANQYMLSSEYNKAQEYYYQAIFLGGKGWEHYLAANIKRIICLEKMDNYEEMLFFADKLLQEGIESLDLLYLLGTAYYKKSKYLRAIKRLRQCAQLGEAGKIPDYMAGCESYKVYYLLGKAYEKIEDYSTAFIYYERALLTTDIPNKPAIKIAKLLLKSSNDREQVAQELECYFNLDNPESLITLAYVFYENKCYDIALVYTEKSMRIAGRLDYLVYLQACCLFFLSHFSLSGALFRKIPKESEYYYAAQDFLCWCYWQIGEYSKANYVIDLMKENPVYQDICEIYSRVNSILIDQKEIVPLMPLVDNDQEKWNKHILGVLEKMLALNNQLQFELALKILELVPSKNIWGDLGKICYYYGLEEKAKKYLLYHLRENLNDQLTCGILEDMFSPKEENKNSVSKDLISEADTYLSFYSMAELHYESEEYDEALIHYEKSLTLNPNFIQPLYKIASIVLSNMEERQAQKYLENRLDLDNPISLLFLAHLFYEEKKYEVALDYLEKLKGTESQEQQAIYYRGKCFYRLGNYQEALRALEMMQENSQYYYAALDCSCYCLWTQGLYQEVERVLNILATNSQNLFQVEVYTSFNNYFLNKSFRKAFHSKKDCLERKKWIYHLIENYLELRIYKEEGIWKWLASWDKEPDNLRIGQIYYKLGNYQKAKSYLVKNLEDGIYSAELFALLKKISVLNSISST